MSYAIIKNTKYKRENLKGIFRHNERRNKNYSNENIDKEKSYLNYSLKSPQYSYEKEFNRIKEKYNLKGQIKTVSNIACEYIITSDHDYFERIGEEATKRYFETAYKFVAEYKELGEQYIMSAKVHMDEQTPHMHLVFLPVVHTQDKKGNEIDKLACSKFWKAKDSYRQLQDAFYKYFDEKVISMYALGMSDKDIQEQIKEIFGCNLSPDMISDITDKIIPEVQEWQKRKLESVYPIVFIDATHFHVRDNGQIVKKAAYVVLGIDKDGMKKVLTITIGENESAKYWMTVLNELKNRGVQDILVLCADGLTGLKDAISAIYPKTEYQRCIVHQIRNSLKYVPYTDRKELANDLETVYKASTEKLGYTNLLELEEKWKHKYQR